MHVLFYALDYLLYNSIWCRNLKLPSRRPSVVCENCLYSLQRDRRARAFHILEPKGTVDMLILFLEERSDGPPPVLDSSGVSLTEMCATFFYCLCVSCIFDNWVFAWNVLPILTAAEQYLMYLCFLWPFSFMSGCK